MSQLDLIPRRAHQFEPLRPLWNTSSVAVTVTVSISLIKSSHEHSCVCCSPIHRIQSCLTYISALLLLTDRSGEVRVQSIVDVRNEARQDLCRKCRGDIHSRRLSPKVVSEINENAKHKGLCRRQRASFRRDTFVLYITLRYSDVMATRPRVRKRGLRNIEKRDGQQ